MDQPEKAASRLFVGIVISILIAGCATTPPPPQLSPEEKLERWFSACPPGFQKQMYTAALACEAYHAITDTPIKELQTEAGAQRIGDIVTAARDAYRQWESYGAYHVPDPPVRGPLPSVGSVVYRSGSAKRGPEPIMYMFTIATYGAGALIGALDGYDAVEGVIVSPRNRPVFGGSYGNERKWRPLPPFDDILQGDRIADIPSLIGKIKR